MNNFNFFYRLSIFKYESQVYDLFSRELYKYIYLYDTNDKYYARINFTYIHNEYTKKKLKNSKHSKNYKIEE